MNIYFYHIGYLNTAEQMKMAEKALEDAGWEDRVEASRKFRMEADRKRCLSAGLALLLALRDLKITDRLRILKGPDGKPYFADFPGVHFNLSHSGNYAVCAVSDHAVGVDIQAPAEVKEALVRYCCTDAERLLIENSISPSAIFTEIWSWKEAFVKMTGEGLRISPRKIDVSFAGAADGGPAAEDFLRENPGCGPMNDSLRYGRLRAKDLSAAVRIRAKGIDVPEMRLYGGRLGDCTICVCRRAASGA